MVKTSEVMLVQLVNGSAGQGDAHRFEPYLVHNQFRCCLFLVKSWHFGLSVGTCMYHKAKLVISLSRLLCTKVEYFIQSLPEETKIFCANLGGPTGLLPVEFCPTLSPLHHFDRLVVYNNNRLWRG